MKTSLLFVFICVSFALGKVIREHEYADVEEGLHVHEVISDAFHNFDMNKDGELVFKEFWITIQETEYGYDLTEEEAKIMFDASDRNLDKIVTFQEFREFVIAVRRYGKIWKIFAKLHSKVAKVDA